jgi:hypothetical protein
MGLSPVLGGVPSTQLCFEIDWMSDVFYFVSYLRKLWIFETIELYVVAGAHPEFLIWRENADFSGWFRLMGKSRKIFDIILSTKSVSFKFRFWGFGRAAARQPPPPLGAPLCGRMISELEMIWKETVVAHVKVLSLCDRVLLLPQNTYTKACTNTYRLYLVYSLSSILFFPIFYCFPFSTYSSSFCVCFFPTTFSYLTLSFYTIYKTRDLHGTFHSCALRKWGSFCWTIADVRKELVSRFLE